MILYVKVKRVSLPDVVLGKLLAKLESCCADILERRNGGVLFRSCVYDEEHELDAVIGYLHSKALEAIIPGP